MGIIYKAGVFIKKQRLQLSFGQALTVFGGYSTLGQDEIKSRTSRVWQDTAKTLAKRRNKGMAKKSRDGQLGAAITTVIMAVVAALVFVLFKFAPPVIEMEVGTAYVVSRDSMPIRCDRDNQLRVVNPENDEETVIIRLPRRCRETCFPEANQVLQLPEGSPDGVCRWSSD